METDDSPGPAQKRDGIYLTVLNRPKIKKRCMVSYHNLTHKYLDLKINLSELLQILCETYAPP
ncbi:hypothetical protein LEP1GSC123_2081 [Leptospira borgpetersenii str. 200701203]|uniref:Uncharacterized protein n=1 Tax=Leptospira borgpetersenii str. 200701203 TaxID=1193007 RepID=M3F974_LEPBO|nr:hypothetical protein LEP1GSC123_2081 [Leptospira borgpetersenii str. 200701203]